MINDLKILEALEKKQLLGQVWIIRSIITDLTKSFESLTLEEQTQILQVTAHFQSFENDFGNHLTKMTRIIEPKVEEFDRFQVRQVMNANLSFPPSVSNKLVRKIGEMLALTMEHHADSLNPLFLLDYFEANSLLHRQRRNNDHETFSMAINKIQTFLEAENKPRFFKKLISILTHYTNEDTLQLRQLLLNYINQESKLPSFFLPDLEKCQQVLSPLISDENQICKQVSNLAYVF